MKHILITGANRGIGLELVRQYAGQGHRVYAGCRSPQKAVKLEELAARYPDLIIVQLDVTRQEDLNSMAAIIEAAGGQLDILINNAGVMPETEALETLDPEVMSEAFRINAIAPLQVVRHCLPLLENSDQPLIMNISSQRGAFSLPQPYDRYSYCSSKAALNMLTRQLAAELQPMNAIVLAMHPGWVQTDMGGPNGTLSPHESAVAMLAFLEQVSPAHNGGFYKWDGSEHRW